MPIENARAGLFGFTDSEGGFHPHASEEELAEVRALLVRCARDRGRVPDQREYRLWLRQRQRQGEYPLPVFCVELAYNFRWNLALYDAGLRASPDGPFR
jgi:hypothetical protein